MAIIIIYWKQGFLQGVPALPKIRFQKVSWCGSESIYYTSLEFDLSDLRSPLAAWCCPLGSSSEQSQKRSGPSINFTSEEKRRQQRRT